MQMIRIPIVLAFWLFLRYAAAAPCEAEDFTTRVSGSGECVVIAAYGQQQTERPRTLVVWLHGDHSAGGAATSHVKPARDAANRLAGDHVMAVAMWRPGYEDVEGHASGGDLHSRSDHYTKTNVAIVAGAIERLKDHWKPERTVLVGHSGGAATVAIALGMFPSLANGALLLSCPCDLRAWRARRAWWPRSEDPLRWADSVSKSVRVIALTGSADDNTTPELAQSYIGVAKALGANARFEAVPGASHNSILGEPQVPDALARLVSAP